MGKKRYNKTINLNAVRDCDFILTNTHRPSGGLIRFSSLFDKGLRYAVKAIKSRGIPNHLLIAMWSYKQLWAHESTPKNSFERNPIHKYLDRKYSVITAAQWKGFDDEAIRQRACEYIEWWTRRCAENDTPYDWRGAPMSTSFGSKILGRFGVADTKAQTYCSEVGIELLVWCGFLGMMPADRTGLLTAIDQDMRDENGRLPKWHNPHAFLEWARQSGEFTFHQPFREKK